MTNSELLIRNEVLGTECGDLTKSKTYLKKLSKKAFCPPHGDECPRPRLVDGSGCVCDLRKWARQHSDWPIAKLVGSATYAQLLDSAPGLFEPFPDFRSDGNSTTSICKITSADARLERGCYKRGHVPRENEAPPPPNTVSVLLAEGYLAPADLKRMLIVATINADVSGVLYPTSNSYTTKTPTTLCDCSETACESNPKSRAPCENTVFPLVGSSISYTFPENTLGEVFFAFFMISVFIGVVSVVILGNLRKRH